MLSVLATTASPLNAQIVGPVQQQGVPFGSPLDPSLQSPSSSVSQPSRASDATSPAVGTVAPIQPVQVSGTTSGGSNAASGSLDTSTREALKPPALPSEFELYTERMFGRKLPRFGSDLLTAASRDYAVPTTATVPPSYILNPGDRIQIGLSGSVEGQLDAEIDTDGRIFLPKVGAVRVAGVSYGDLRAMLIRAVGEQYRDFRLSATISHLRGIRVYVTGFANNPGAYTVNSLSTLINAVLAAGGPSAGGSFRTIKLYRNNQLISDFDLYDFVRNGDKTKDVILQNEDVLYIPAVGPQVAITGSVNDEAIYEARPGESLSALMKYAGGADVLADKSRVVLYRLSNKSLQGGVEMSAAALPVSPIQGGDIVQVLSEGTLRHPIERQASVVRVDGEVERPGNYFVGPNTTLDQVLAMAGGLTSRAFVYGSVLQRTSVRQQQRDSFEEAIRQLELSLAAAPLTADTSIDGATRAAQIAAARAVLDRLRQTQPDGRVVINPGGSPATTVLPTNFLVENNDRLYVPAKPMTVGVFGAVYRPASFLLNGTPKTVREYLNLAGGPLRAADKGQIFVVRQNGEVISKKRGALNAAVIPGDVIFVPVKTQSSTIWARILQITTIAFQLGLSTAAIVALTN